jgi:replicative DNA helicase
LNTAPIHIDDHPSGSISEVVAKVTRLHQRDGLGLAVIDYLQLMKAPGESRRHEIDAITRSLKELAVRLDIPIILLSQLSRAPEARTNHRPILSDLRESGGIEQDADLVLFIYRPEMYVQDDDGPAKQTEADSARRALEGKAELILAKQRNGPTGVIPLYFNKAFTRFDSVQHGGPTP